MNIELKIAPLSVNRAWQGKRFKTKEYSKYEFDVLFLLPKSKFDFDGMIRVELFFGFSNPLSDIDNPVKPILDILQKRYGFDDRQIFELNLRKCLVKKGEEFISINIEKLLPFP